MKVETCINLINDLVSEAEVIVNSGAIANDQYSTDKHRDTVTQMKQLMRTLFPDADKRLNDYEQSIIIAARRDDMNNTGIFLEQAKVIRRFLVSMKDSLKLRESVEIKDDKLDKLRHKVKEKEIESERREKVTETKFYGAAIEIIDRLRDELRNYKTISEQIISIEGDIEEIKKMLYAMTSKEKNK